VSNKKEKVSNKKEKLNNNQILEKPNNHQMLEKPNNHQMLEKPSNQMLEKLNNSNNNQMKTLIVIAVATNRSWPRPS